MADFFPPAPQVAAALKRGVVVQPTGIRTDVALSAPMTPLALPAFGPIVGTPGTPIYVDAGAQYQPFYGVGAALTDSAAYCLTNYMTAAQRTAFLTEAFGTNGFSMLRLPIGSCDYVSYQPFATYADNGGNPDPNLASFSMAHEQQYTVPLLQQILAINPKVRIIACPWSPPIWMKTSGTIIGGTFVASVANMTALAQYFVKVIQTYAALGIPIWAINCQNELNYSPTAYPGCIWAAGDSATFIGTYLGPAFDAAGITTRILCGDCAWGGSTNPYVTTPMSTAASFAYLEGAAYHGYTGSPLQQLQDMRSYPSKSVHMTEWQNTFGYSNASALAYAAGDACIYSVRANGSSVMFWNLMLDQNGAPNLGSPSSGNYGRGVVTVNNSTGAITRNTEYYVFAHLGRYLQNGAKRCYCSTRGTPGSSGTDVQSVAFANPDGSVVVFVWNASTISRNATIQDAITGLAVPVTLAPDDIVTVTWGAGPTVAPGSFAAPSAPLSPVAVNSFAQAALTWTAPQSSGGSDLGGYAIYRGTSAGGEATCPMVTLAPGSLAWTDTTVAVGLSYFYRIAAFGAGGTSLQSPEFSIAVTATAPDVPTLAVAPGNAQNVLTMTPPARTGGSAITGYTIYRGTSAGGEAGTPIAINVASPYTDTGLTNGTTYYYRPAAVNGAGTGNQGTEVSATPSNVSSHYLSASGTSGSVSAPPATALNLSTYFLDAQVFVSLSTYSYTSNLAVLIGQYPASGGSSSSCSWNLNIFTNGTLCVQLFSSNGTYRAYNSSVTLASVLAVNTPVYLRAVLNAGSSAANDYTGVSRASGTVNFFYSMDGNTWTFLGTANQSASTDGFKQPGTAGVSMQIAAATGGIGVAGKVYSATVRNGTTVILNPNFTQLATGTTSFQDTAPTPNTWTVTANESVT